MDSIQVLHEDYSTITKLDLHDTNLNNLPSNLKELNCHDNKLISLKRLSLKRL